MYKKDKNKFSLGGGGGGGGSKSSNYTINELNGQLVTTKEEAMQEEDQNYFIDHNSEYDLFVIKNLNCYFRCLLFINN